VIEKWESRAALDAHAATAHMVEFNGWAEGLTAAKTIHVLEDVAA
jgi:quinol monooxygenase YgiN